mgnify:CR=1 FL=1
MTPGARRTGRAPVWPFWMRLAEEPGAARWHLFHAVRADLLRRLGETGGAAEAYRQALECGPNGVDRRFLEARLEEMRAGPPTAR